MDKSSVEARVIDGVLKLVDTYSNSGRAFVAWYLSTLKDIPENELESVVTDGSGDEGVDAVIFDDDEKEVRVYQGKFSETTEGADVNVTEISNTFETISQLKKGVITTRRKKLRALLSLCGEKLQDSEWSLRIVILTNRGVANEVKQRYQGDPGVDIIDFDKIYYELTKEQPESPSINAELKYVPNQSYVSEQSTGEVLVCTMKGTELAALYKKHGKDLFWRNVRYGLGSGKPVNKGIRATLLDPVQRNHFWLFNNGVTIICDKIKNDAEHSMVGLSNLSIINGAQTTSTLADHFHHAKVGDVAVLVKIIEVPSESDAIIQSIVKYTNKQTATMSQDFIANDPKQKKLAEDLREYGYFYDYKRGLWEVASTKERGSLQRMKAADLAYAVLAFNGKPGEARNDKKNYFEDKGHYNDIFAPERSPAEYALIYEILQKVKLRIKKLKLEFPDKQYGYLAPFLVSVIGSIFRTLIEPKVNLQKLVQLPSEEFDDFLNQLVLAGLETMEMLIREEKIKNVGLDVDNFSKSRRVNEVSAEADGLIAHRDREAIGALLVKYKRQLS